MFEPAIDSEQVFVQDVRMQRTYVRRRVVALAVVIGVMSLPAAAVAMLPGSGADPAARTHVVRSGETLWRIASRYVPDRDPRDTVADLAALNRVDPGSLVPGQVLVVPSPG